MRNFALRLFALEYDERVNRQAIFAACFDRRNARTDSCCSGGRRGGQRGRLHLPISLRGQGII